MWQQSYFYVENIDPAADFLNLTAYEAGPPAEPRASWGYKPNRCRQTVPPPSNGSGS